jgi:large subunit ribosomal protein L13e
MAIKHNNQISNGHYRKYWQKYVKCWFNQPARAIRRRSKRAEKAKRTFPRPTAGLLRPVVHPPTQRYNYKVRLGRGFTLDELKAAGIPRKQALSIGISVDHRRKNRCTESLQTNVERLKTYKSKLLLFPLRQNKPKKGDATQAELESCVQNTHKDIIPVVRKTLNDAARAVTAEEKEFSAFKTMRKSRADRKLKGKREVQLKAKEEAKKSKK